MCTMFWERSMLTIRRRPWIEAAMTRAVLAAWLVAATAAQQPGGGSAPTFQVDPSWPSIPNNWVLGEVTSISVDRHDNIWVLHVPQSIPEAQRANAAPPVLEFDA